MVVRCHTACGLSLLLLCAVVSVRAAIPTEAQRYGAEMRHNLRELLPLTPYSV